MAYPRKYTEEFLKQKKYGALTYIGPSIPVGHGSYIGKWKCDCGTIVECTDREVVMGRKKSCSCNMFKKGDRHHGWSGCGEITGSHWNGIQTNAKNRNKSFEITIQDAWEQFLKQDRKCALTGEDLTLSSKERYGRTASLDRIDSSKGYTKDNIQWVHKDINYIKRDLSDAEFVRLCKLVAHKHP